MLWQRVVTAIVGIPILMALIYVGGWVMLIGLGILSTIMVREMSQMMRQARRTFFPVPAMMFSWSFFLAIKIGWPLGLLVASLLMISAVITLWEADQHGLEGAVLTLWSALYLGWFFAFFLQIRDLTHGRFLAFGFIVVIWATDTVAYAVGRTWGRHKLTLRVSPGKTWEGSIAGTVAGVLSGLGLAQVGPLPDWQGMLLGFSISVAGQFGDLVESNLKRYFGVKDSGHLLPGHGGMLDRFDSALFALPLAYYLLGGLGIK